MPTHKVRCPVPGCEYETEESTKAFAVALLNAHTTTHAGGIMAQNQTPSAKVEKLKRPTVSADATSEDWEYFLTRWGEYRKETRLTGEDVVTQLLEYCDQCHMKKLGGGRRKNCP